MNKDEFISELEKLNINLTIDQLKKFLIYKDFLIEYNAHTNITSIKNEKDIFLKHFYDSLTINKFIKNGFKVLDIGTGAGFPSIPLAIINENTNFVLLDSNNKKTKFLNELQKKLNLKNVTIVNLRAEDYVHNHKCEFDIVTSRAVAKLHILSELSIPALKINGLFIPLKSSVSEEYPLFLDALEELNGEISLKEEFYLPVENSLRTIIVVKHIDKTNSIYPRTYDKILKKPLKKIHK